MINVSGQQPSKVRSTRDECEMGHLENSIQYSRQRCNATDTASRFELIASPNQRIFRLKRSNPRGCSLPNRVYGFEILKKIRVFWIFFRIFWVFLFFSDFLDFFRIFLIFRIFSDFLDFFSDFLGFSNFLDFSDFSNFLDFFRFFFDFFRIFLIFSDFPDFFLSTRIL